jgi:hypothetical protein
VLDAARVEQIEHGASVRGESGGGLRVGAVAQPVSRDAAWMLSRAGSRRPVMRHPQPRTRLQYRRAPADRHDRWLP